MHFELLPKTHIAEAHENPFLGDEEKNLDSMKEVDETIKVTAVVTTEDAVRTYFADIPILQEVARCESRFRQYDSTGRPLRNMHGSSATGVMQIMSSVHRDTALHLGYDIDTLEGNMGYARYLYERNGTRDWNASRHCWGNKQVTQT